MKPTLWDPPPAIRLTNQSLGLFHQFLRSWNPICSILLPLLFVRSVCILRIIFYLPRTMTNAPRKSPIFGAKSLVILVMEAFCNSRSNFGDIFTLKPHLTDYYCLCRPFLVVLSITLSSHHKRNGPYLHNYPCLDTPYGVPECLTIYAQLENIF